VGLTERVLDFSPVLRRERTIQDLAEDLSPEDLAALTQEMCDRQLELIAGAVDFDVTFVPEDPDAHDEYAADPSLVDLAWTLGHVILHSTASSEESAALALTLARGLPVTARSRYEVPWEEATTVAFLRQRIQESRRMRLAMLDAWPEQPHYENSYSPREGRPPINCKGRFLSGLSHDDSHLDQIGQVLAQARAARPARAGGVRPE
jgi:DinB superfamily